MFKKSDFFFLLAIMISFFVSGYLWFGGQRMEGIFTENKGSEPIFST